jgi:putative FmdB family regulatory protein
MPLYEYQCTQCSDRTEVLQNFSDPPQAVCAKCGGEMKKLFSAPAIQFKGSGFYKTDYASKSSAAPSSSSTESKGDAKSESKSESKTESKSETKAESKAETASSTTTKSSD